MSIKNELKIAKVILLAGGDVTDVAKCKIFRMKAKSELKAITANAKLSVIEKIIDIID
jgi:hypothetical protein